MGAYRDAIEAALSLARWTADRVREAPHLDLVLDVSASMAATEATKGDQPKSAPRRAASASRGFESAIGATATSRTTGGLVIAFWASS